MAYRLRRMKREDVPRVAAIDREAFPTQLPPPNYNSEMRNQTAFFYVVCCDDELSAVPPPTQETPQQVSGIFSFIKRLFQRKNSFNQQPIPEDNIVGFIGSWFMVDELHITAIAVSESYRRRSIGEMLLASAIDLAQELKAGVVTLEVRVSNTSAQSLYTKYGFNHAGVRKGYYTDNREDALIMTTDILTSDAFQQRFQQLKQDLQRRHGANSPQP